MSLKQIREKIKERKAMNELSNESCESEMCSDTPNDKVGVTKSYDDPPLEDSKESYRYYTYIGNNTYMPLNEIEFKYTLPTGLYSIVYDNEKNCFTFQRTKFETDKVYDLPIKELDLIKTDISKFWSKEKKFKEYGLVHKRGILLYGKPGCGKSCAIQLVIKDLIDNHNGLVFKISNSDDLQVFSSQFNNVIRTIEPHRRVVTILEDIDGLFEESKSTQTKLLNLLDGINQNSNIVYVGTTNYPEKLEERILNRPSRFDKRYRFGLPSDDVREAYLLNSLKPHDIKEVDLDYWIEQTDGLTLSHLRELIVSVIILENDFEVEIETLKGMSVIPSSSSDRDGSGAGFKMGRSNGKAKKKEIVGFGSNGNGEGRSLFDRSKGEN